MSISLGALLDGEVKLAPAEAGLIVSGLTSDSRRVKPGHVFFALAGTRADGANFIKDAVAKGAGAVIAAGRVEGEQVIGVGADVHPAVGEHGGGVDRRAEIAAPAHLAFGGDRVEVVIVRADVDGAVVTDDRLRADVPGGADFPRQRGGARTGDRAPAGVAAIVAELACGSGLGRGGRRRRGRAFDAIVAVVDRRVASASAPRVGRALLRERVEALDR